MLAWRPVEVAVQLGKVRHSTGLGKRDLVALDVTDLLEPAVEAEGEIVRWFLGPPTGTASYGMEVASPLYDDVLERQPRAAERIKTEADYIDEVRGGALHRHQPP